MDPNAEGVRRSDTALALIEQLDRHGQVVQCVRVHRWPFRIGRSLEADMVSNDPHLAPLHAELDARDGIVRLRVGETLNGALVEGRPLHTGESMVLPPARTWRMGATNWRVRLASDPLPPEQPLGRQMTLPVDAPALPAWRQVVPWLGVSVLVTLFQQWLDNNPGTPANAYLGAVLSTLGMTMGWALFWALGNKLFQGRLDFKAHLRLVLLYGLGWTSLQAGLPLLAYAMDWPALSRIAGLTTAGLVCALIWAHLVWIMPAHRRGLVAGVVTLYLTGAGLSVWFTHQRTGQYFSERYVTALPPPAWRLVGTQPVPMLMEDARQMKAGLDRQAREQADESEAFLLEE